MQVLSALLADSASRIARPYFRVPIAGGRPTLRERVYCYELYHQMRCRWPANEGYALNGELDKAAHPILSGLGLGRIKPDLLVHRPGDMHGNHAVIEVKCSTARADGLKKDLQTLASCRRFAGYKRAILLVFGETAERAIARVTAQAATAPDLPTIELWFHPSEGAPAIFARNVGNARHNAQPDALRQAANLRRLAPR